MAVGAAIGGVVGGLAQAGAARSAAKSQERAAGRQLELQDRMYQQSREDLAPYRESGGRANRLLEYYLGITDEMPNIPGTGTAPEIEVVGGGLGGGRAGGSLSENFNIPTVRDFAELGFAAVSPRNMLTPQFRLQAYSDDQIRRALRSSGDREPDTGYARRKWKERNKIRDLATQVARQQAILGGGGTRYRVGGQEFATREEAEAYAESQRTDARPMPGFQESPGYEFAVGEALDAVESGAAARGGLYSGATMQALQQRGNDLANMEFYNYLANLTGQVTRGQNAAAQSATVNQNNAQMGSNALANMGNAQAAGAIGVGNAISGAINNGIGLWQYQNTLSQYPGGSGGMFGGFGGGGFNPQAVSAPTPAWSGILGGYA